MGLAQKRIVAKFQDSKYKLWKEEFDKVCGVSIDIEVKWDTMQDDSYSAEEQYFTWYEAVYFRPLMKVFKDLCSDQMGKDAVKEKVKKIIIDGTNGSTPGASSFGDGLFRLNHKFSTNVSDEEDRVEKWTKMISNAL